MFSFFLLPNGHISHHYNLEILYWNLNQNTQNCIIHLIEKSSKILIILVFYSTLFEMCLFISQWKRNRCTKKTITLINRCIKKKIPWYHSFLWCTLEYYANFTAHKYHDTISAMLYIKIQFNYHLNELLNHVRVFKSSYTQKHDVNFQRSVSVVTVM